MPRYHVASFLGVCGVLAACSTPSTAPLDSGSPLDGVLYPDGCDPIVSGPCGYPFPSNVWTVPDAQTPTGLHLEIPAGIFAAVSGATDTSVVRSHDGFSANGA